jgi:regulator of CtrA degradation
MSDGGGADAVAPWPAMGPLDTRTLMTARLVDGLYTEAMLLADEARAYFDEAGRTERERLSPLDRVAFSCESLKVTTRLMHVIAWLLTRKAVAAGELREDARNPARRLGEAGRSDPRAVAALPDAARALIRASTDLYDRIAQIDRDMAAPQPGSPALGLIRQIERAF